MYQKVLTLLTHAFPQLSTVGVAPAVHHVEPHRTWERIKPSEEFHWHDCFDKFKCARLQVPMDWQGTTAEKNQTVEIAVIKVEATVPVTDSRYGGAVVVNPGGPGGSGVSFILGKGHHLQTVVSAGPDTAEDTAKYFDIISFDPRGVNNTRPYITCFPDHIAASAWEIQTRAHGYFDSSDRAFDDLWARSRALAAGCSDRIDHVGIGKHVSTAAVARDIVEIIERHGEWRAKEAKRLVKRSHGQHKTRAEKDAIVQRTKYHKGQEKLQYWGLSYGTMLGGTFTSMYPDRARRVVLDGVVDFDDYMAGTWASNLRDTDRQAVLLSERCFDVGPKHCPIYDQAGAAAILQSINDTIAHLHHNPIEIPGNSTVGPTTIRSDDVRRFIRYAVYKPLSNFPALVQILHELRQNRTTTLLARMAAREPPLGVPLPEDCTTPYSHACMRRFTADDMSLNSAIACSDGAPARTNETKASYRAYAEDLAAQSTLLGAFWAGIMMPCTAWRARAAWRYEGDFRTPDVLHSPLLVGNTLDPVTPLHNARSMAERYGGAGVVHLDAAGHCAGAGVSRCAMRAIREYFQSGTLPGSMGGVEGYEGYGAFCEPDRLILDGYTDEGEVPIPKGEEDEALWEAIVGLERP